jgi:hypothetical protein
MKFQLNEALESCIRKTGLPKSAKLFISDVWNRLCALRTPLGEPLPE